MVVEALTVSVDSGSDAGHKGARSRAAPRVRSPEEAVLPPLKQECVPRLSGILLVVA